MSGLRRRAGHQLIGRRAIVAGIVVSALALGACGEDEGSQDGPFYEGKTIEIWVPSSPGGGSEAISQSAAKAIRDHGAGSPEVELEYVTGAGGFQAGNDYANLREYDGETLLLVNLTLMTAWLMDEEGVGWDLRNFRPIVTLPPTTMWGVASDTGVEEATDLLDPSSELVVGGRSPASTALPDALGYELLGIRDNLQEIYGYDGNSDMVLAFEQGEINMLATSSAGWLGRIDLVEDGFANVLATHGIGLSGELKRDPVWPDVPLVTEVYEEMHGEPPQGEFFQAYKTVVENYSYGGTVVVHKDAPEEAVSALREALVAASKDPEWAKFKNKQVGEIEPLVGDAAVDVEKTWQNIDQDQLTLVRDYIHETYADVLN